MVLNAIHMDAHNETYHLPSARYLGRMLTKPPKRFDARRRGQSNPMSLTTKLLGGAVLLGVAGGIGSAVLAPPQIVAGVTEGDWKPRNTIGRETPMSAAELDVQQPGAPSLAGAPTRQHAATSAVAIDWTYRNCREARSAGAAPIYRGQPGYGAHMDGDGDGIACEPYYGR